VALLESRMKPLRAALPDPPRHALATQLFSVQAATKARPGRRWICSAIIVADYLFDDPPFARLNLSDAEFSCTSRLPYPAIDSPLIWDRRWAALKRYGARAPPRPPYEQAIPTIICSAAQAAAISSIITTRSRC
jgi:hypothetical protein